MADRILLSIGTRKGVFVAESSSRRGRFELRGPFGQGVGVYTTMIDTRSKAPRVYASSCNAFFGMKLLYSTDLGKKFRETKATPAFSKKDGRALANIWSLVPGKGKKELWCGVEPAALFHSTDNGNSWEMVKGISKHKHQKDWAPGAGGLCLHTIMRCNGRMHVGISTGGHYISDDGGKTFDSANEGIGAGFSPDPYPDHGQ
ncbi:MAG: WD40/YVTN/BNR-like repeat-containing protein [Pirellulaceae bacterium]